MCRVLLALTVLVALLLCLCLLPAVALSLFLTAVTPATLVVLLALLPMATYGAAAPSFREGLRQRLDPGREERLRDKDTRALTVAGFSLASLSVLVRFYGEQVGQHEHSVVGLAIALGFFVGAYMLLRFRQTWYSDYFSDALLDSGLWSVLMSLGFLFWGVLRSAWALSVVVVAMIGFIAYIALHINLYRRFFKNLQRSGPGAETRSCPYYALLRALGYNSQTKEVKPE